MMLRKRNRHLRRRQKVFKMQQELIRGLRDVLKFMRNHRDELTQQDRERALEITDRVGVIVDLEEYRRDDEESRARKRRQRRG